MRKIVALVAAAVMLFALCASASAATPVTIWHTFTDNQQAYLEQAAADFNASQDEYEVVVEAQAYSGFLDSVYNAVANGVGPSIIINFASTAAEYVKDGLVVDLTPYVYDEEIKTIIECGKYVERLDLYFRMNYQFSQIEREFGRLCASLRNVPKNTPYRYNTKQLCVLVEVMGMGDSYTANSGEAISALGRLFEPVRRSVMAG